MTELGGADVPREDPDSVPAPVQIAVWSAYALALSLLLFGVLGLLISREIDDSVGGGAFLLGLIVAGAAYMLSRGSSLGRMFIGLGAAATAVACLIYMFAGPGSAFIPCLVIGALAAGTFALLYLSDSARAFFSKR